MSRAAIRFVALRGAAYVSAAYFSAPPVLASCPRSPLRGDAGRQVVQQDCSPVWRLQRFVARLPGLAGQWLRAEVLDYNRVRWG